MTGCHPHHSSSPQRYYFILNYPDLFGFFVICGNYVRLFVELSETVLIFRLCTQPMVKVV